MLNRIVCVPKYLLLIVDSFAEHHPDTPNRCSEGGFLMLFLLQSNGLTCSLLLQQLHLGDIVISVEIAQWRAEERGQILLGEIRIFTVG